MLEGRGKKGEREDCDGYVRSYGAARTHKAEFCENMSCERDSGQQSAAGLDKRPRGDRGLLCLPMISGSVTDYVTVSACHV